MLEFQLKGECAVPFSAYQNEVEGASSALCIVHGVGEHFTRYQEMADMLGARGYNVYGMDLYGHGTSPGSRGYIGSREDFCGQITALVEYAASRMKGKPVFLMGHSLGGLLVLYYRLKFPDCLVRGFALCSPWLGLTHTYSQSDIRDFQKIVDADPLAVHDTDISPKKLFTREKDRKIPRDPTMHPYIAYKNLLERLADIETVFEYAHEKRRDTYIFVGSEDPICDIQKTMEWAKRQGEGCTVRVWEGLKHEPWNEPSRAEVIGELADWLDKTRR